MEKIIVRLILLMFVVGCVSKPVTKGSAANDTLKPAESPVEVGKQVTDGAASSPTTSQSQVSLPPSNGIPPTSRAIPKIGIIFSGGGAKAWAHIGVLKEIEKAKWPVHSVAGFEWGAVVAAVYANNLSSNEVEWEFSKVRDFENVEDIANTLFEKKSVSDFKIPFVCASLNISTQSVFFLNRGQLNKLIPFCLAQPPLSKPYNNSVAEMHDVAGLAQHLRATGAKKIVLINVLAQNSKRSFTENSLSSDNILWSESAALMAKKVSGVDDVISINLDGYGISEIEKKREIIAKGSELGYDEIRKLTAKYGF